jgi:hypothetical protein
MAWMDDLNAIRNIIKKGNGGCLCGHGESCPNCNGEADEQLSIISDRVDEYFSRKYGVLIIKYIKYNPQVWDFNIYSGNGKYICIMKDGTPRILKANKCNYPHVFAEGYTFHDDIAYVSKVPGFLETDINDSNVAGYIEKAIIRKSSHG